MKGLILAGGTGTRLGMQPGQNKHMVLINGKPMIRYALDAMLEKNGASADPPTCRGVSERKEIKYGGGYGGGAGKAYRRAGGNSSAWRGDKTFLGRGMRAPEKHEPPSGKPGRKLPNLFGGGCHTDITDLAVLSNDSIDGVVTYATNYLYEDNVVWWTDGHMKFFTQPYPGGIAHAVLMAKEWVGNEPFIVLLGDNLFQNGLKPFVDAYVPDETVAVCGVAEVPDPERFGVVTFGPDGKVVSIEEKPKTPAGNLALVGAYVFTGPEVFDIIEAQKPSTRGELEITDTIRELVHRHPDKVKFIRVKGYWKDVGTPESLAEAEKLLGKVEK